MKRIRGAAGILACTIILSGCGAQIPNMTEEQTEVVTQYAADLLLKYDRNYDSGIMSEDEMAKLMRRQITPTPRPEADEPQPDENGQDEIPEELIGGGDSDIVVDHRTMSEFFGMDGIDISFTGYGIYDSYPESDSDEFYFAMDAVEGCKLLVLQFQVTNQSAQEQAADILNQSARFRVYINGGKQQNALSTLLTDDLKNMNITLDAGASVNEVIVLEISEEEAALFQSGDAVQLDMTVKTADDSLTISLLP